MSAAPFLDDALEPRWSATFPQPEVWPSANDRHHWAKRAQLIRYWRDLAALTARSQRAPILPAAHIVITLHKPTRRKYDPSNYAAPLGKAIVDGLVDAGVIPDDDAAHLIGPDMRAGEVGPRRVVVDVYELGGTR